MQSFFEKKWEGVELIAGNAAELVWTGQRENGRFFVL
jgi:hypothetical protein